MKERFTMLIVHGDPRVRSRLSGIFGDGYDILEAENAQAAFQRIDSSLVDVVILDVTGRTFDGLKALGRLKQTPATATVPVIAYLDGDTVRQRQALEQGADGYFGADYDAAIIRILVGNIVKNYNYRIWEAQRQLAYERVINECLKLIYSAPLTLETLQKILNISAVYMGAQRAYAYETKGDEVICAYEWQAAGVPPQCEALQHVPLKVMELYESLAGGQLYTYIEDIDIIRHAYPGIYVRLSAQGIKSIAMMLIRVDNVLHGLIGFDNPTLPGDELRSFLDNLFFFISIAVDKEVANRRLQRITYYDPLTGLMNRVKFYEEIDLWYQKKYHSAGIFYVDINGLKEANDRQCHEAGDRLIRMCGRILQSACPDGSCYRLGGDEFVVLIPNINSNQFESRLDTLRKTFALHPECKAAVGGSLWFAGHDFRASIVAADHDMYTDKATFYGNQIRDRRKR